ncbi:conserved hypothetical protein [Enterobacterales bacterium 8AC]|nr:conserved hypothetical protein [Enterobacterales bacterium 8AC]
MAGNFLTRMRNKALSSVLFKKETLTSLLLLALCASGRSAVAGLQIELVGTHPNITSVSIRGNVNDVPVLSSTPVAVTGIYFSTLTGVPPGVGYEYIQVNAHFADASKRYLFHQRREGISTCPRDVYAWRNYINSRLGSLNLPLDTVVSDIHTSNYISLAFNCVSVVNGTSYNGFFLAVTPGYDIEVVNPPPASAACSLNGQNMSLDFNSTSLNVNGLSQTQNLSVSCTSGTAKDYNLRLTGSNVTDGRLNFGNGVSAQIYLNGTAVRANDASGIRLNALTSRTVSVRGDLVGTASGAGTTNAFGVLILDAL